MEDAMAAYINACEQSVWWQIERSKLAQKAAEAWYDGLSPEQRAVFLKFADNKEMLQHVQMRATKLQQEDIERRRLELVGSSAGGTPAH
jgi:hypothetical protein